MTINILKPKPDPDLLDPSTTSKMDIENIYFCRIHNGCLLRDDTYMDEKGERYCRKHKYPVIDVTNAPMGQAYRHVVSPKPRQ